MSEMQVEVFQSVETCTMQDITDEVKVLVDKLELTGQAPQAEVGTTFRKMLADEKFVYTVLCPEHIKVEDYDATMIPLRVLQTLEVAKESGLFTEFQVWDKESATVKDPVLVGIRMPNPERTWVKHEYILARWGDELDEFSTLCIKAVKKHRQTITKDLLKVKMRLKADITRLKNAEIGDLMDNGGSPHEYSGTYKYSESTLT